MEKEFTEWKKRLSDLLKERIKKNVTGQVEVNLNEGGVSRIYVINKRTKGDTIIYEKTEIK